jgi:predicted NBD/HSP70 family sugar kinase
MTGEEKRQLIAAIDIGGTKTKVAIADSGRGVLDTVVIPSGSDADGSVLLGAVRDALADLVLHADGSPDGGIAVAGLVSPGVAGEEGIALAPNNPGLTGLSSATIADALGVGSLAWANDVKAATLAEHAWGGLRGARCGLYVNLGTGLAAGAVIEGRPLNGAHGAALEIGFMMPAGPRVPGYRQGAAPLEDIISGAALGAGAESRGLDGWSASEVLERGLGAPDTAPPEARRLAEEFSEQLCRAVVNVAVTLDVDAICFGGGIAAATAVFLEPVVSALGEYCPYPPAVAISERPNDSSLFGALFVAGAEAGWDATTTANPFHGR